jgi:anaerobic ribonucleoside-triphosphate reductase
MLNSMNEIRSNEATAYNHIHKTAVAADGIRTTLGFPFSVSNLPAARAAQKASSKLGSAFGEVANVVRGVGQGSADVQNGLSDADRSSAGAMT